MLCFALLVTALATRQNGSSANYMHDIATWRSDYESELKKPEGWLSVAGLFWLKDGANTVGSDADGAVVIPEYSAMPLVATLTLKYNNVTLTPIPGADLMLNGSPAISTQLKSDMTGAPDQMKVGSVTFHIIQRGKRIGVRLYDPHSKAQRNFKGLHWYPADPSWIVPAHFVAYDPPKQGTITNVLGDTSPTTFPGYLSFKVKGVDCRLDVEDAGNVFFINFQDSTSGKSTYPAGRFLEETAKPDKDGNTYIDFNKATCPPCAYTSFATCPLPPAGNRLGVAITAGEKKFH